MNREELPPYDSFFSNLRNSNSLGKDYNNFQNLANSGLTTKQAVAKLRMDRILPTGTASYSYLQCVWGITTCKISQMSSSGITIKMLFRH